MRVMACVDLSPLSDLVTNAAIDLARATGAELTLLHVARTEPVLSSGGLTPRSGHLIPPFDIAERRLQFGALLERLRAAGAVVDGAVKLCDDSVHEFILSEAAALGAKYVVIGSHGHGRVYEALLGSVTQGVIRHARVPVVVVPAREG